MINDIGPDEIGLLYAKKNADLTYGLIGSSLALHMLFLTTRLYARFRLRGHLRSDDYIMAVGSLAVLAVSIMGMLGPKWGAGWHSTDFELSWAKHFGKLTYAFNITYPLACSLPKIALTITYLQIFPSPRNKLFCHIFMAITIGWCIATTLVAIFQCIPVNGMWELSPKTTTRKCINIQASMIASASANSFSDFCIYLWPTRLIWNIQLPLRQRLGLIAVFCTGAVVCVAGAVRIWFLARFFDSGDQLAIAAIVWAVSVVEVNVGIICGCLHGVRAVMSFSFPSLFSSESREYHSNYHNTSQGVPFQSINLRPKGRESTLSGKDDAWQLDSVSNMDVLGTRRGSTNIRGSWSVAGFDMRTDDVGSLKRNVTSRSDCMGVNTWITAGPSKKTEHPKAGIALTTEVLTEYGCGPPSDSQRNSLKTRDSDSQELILPVDKMH